MKLLYTKRSPYARKVKVVAIEKQIDLEYVLEDLMNKSQELVNSNPLGKIPALILDSGEVIVDSPVICEYLDSLKEIRLFIPKSGKERIKILHWQALADGLMDVTVGMYMEKVRHPNNFNKDFVKAQEDTIKRSLAFFEDHTSELKEVSLASVSMACAIGYLLFRLPDLFAKDKYKKLAAWYEEFSKRPSMTATIPTQ
jgi:glutathione S-transferase